MVQHRVIEEQDLKSVTLTPTSYSMKYNFGDEVASAGRFGDQISQYLLKVNFSCNPEAQFNKWAAFLLWFMKIVVVACCCTR